MARKSTAKRIRDLNTYVGDVGLFELSKMAKNGADSSKFVIVARIKPRSGARNTIVWLADENGKMTSQRPIKEFASKDMIDALDQFGYKLV